MKKELTFKVLPSGKLPEGARVWFVNNIPWYAGRVVKMTFEISENLDKEYGDENKDAGDTIR